MTLNGHWGYFKGDEKWKPAATVIHNLVDIASKGGNYLLNVGPTGKGIIPAGAVADLQAVGAWMKVNGDSIYGTSASPLAAQPGWGRVTRKGDLVYLHVFNWPAGGKLSVTGLNIKQAWLLADAEKKALAIDGGEIELPGKAPDAMDTVVVGQM